MSEKNNRFKKQLEKQLGIPEKDKFERKFLGKIKNFENKEEQKRENKHLRSYLKGYNSFTYGFTFKLNSLSGKTEKIPTVYEVQYELNKI